MKVKDEMPAHIKLIILCALASDIERSKKFAEEARNNADGPSVDFWTKEYKDATEAVLWMRRNLDIVSLLQ